MNSKIFERELTYIEDDAVRKFTETALDNLPQYFFEVAASSTGKYHPMFSTGDGGLVRHTKVAAKIAYDLLTNETTGSSFKQEEKDLMIFAILIHDGLKLGLEEEKYTKSDHPLLVCEYLKEKKSELTLKDSEINFICNAVSSHMGQWNTDYDGNEVLPKPANKYQRFVHMADYLSSRKYLDVKFENNEIVE